MMKHPRLLTPLLAFLLVLLLGVAQADSLKYCWMTPQKKLNTLESWLGHEVDELVTDWGPPTKDYALGTGGKVLTYEYTCHNLHRLTFVADEGGRIVNCSFDNRKCQTKP